MARRTGQTFEISAANQQLARFEYLLTRAPKQIQKAGLRALRKSLRSGVSAASKEVRKVINLPKKTVDKRIKSRVVSKRALIGSVAVRDRRIELSEFMSPAQKAAAYRRHVAKKGKGVKVKTYKNKPAQLYPGTFAQIGKRSSKWHVLKREGKERYPIFIQYGPNMIEHYEKVLPAFAERQSEQMQKYLEHELNREAAKL